MKQSDLEIKAHVETVVSPMAGHFAINCKTVASVTLSTVIHHGNCLPQSEFLEAAQKEARMRLGEYVYGQTWAEIQPWIYDIRRLAAPQNKEFAEQIIAGIYKAFGKSQ
jgi:hypothetical protein